MNNPWPDQRDTLNKSLLVQRPELAAYILEPDPSTVSEHSSKEGLWFCDEGHMWYATIHSMGQKQGSGCPECKHPKRYFEPISVTHPELAAQAYGWDPSTVTADYVGKLEWICSEGHVTTNTMVLKSNGTKCCYCINKKLLKGYNDLATKNPEIAREAYGWDPSEFVFGSGKTKMWKCPVGHIYSMNINHRSSGRTSGCTECSSRGYASSKPGYLYFLRHDDWGMLQIGITNHPEQRIGQHRKSGWNLVEVRGPMEGTLARDLERRILNSLKSLDAELGNQDIAGRFSGYTECWIEESYPVNSLIELVNLCS